MSRYVVAGAVGGVVALVLWALWLTAETEDEADARRVPSAFVPGMTVPVGRRW